MIRKSLFYLCRNALLPALFVWPGTAAGLMAQQEGAAGPYGKIIREIRIEGLRRLEESFVREQLVSAEGSVYTEETAKQDSRWLDRLNVFDAIQASPAVVEGEVVLTIEVREFPQIVPFPTLNITDENGVSGGLGAGSPYLKGRATALSGSVTFGGLTEADVTVQAPWLRQRRLWYRLKYNYKDRVNKLDSFRENSHEVDLRIGVSPHEDWMLSGRFDYMSMGSDTPGITLSPENRDHTPALGFVLEYDGRDSLSLPRRGWRGIFDVTKNGGFLGGNGDFVTTQIDIRRYQPIASRHGLALFSYVTFQSGEVGKDVPVYRDYRLGGTNSVRGWNYDAREGNNQFLNTLEYRYDIMSPKKFRVYGFNLYAGLQLAAFADIGTAWSQGSDFTRNMIGGGGVGLRFLVPFVDAVRMDFAFGQSGTGIHEHIHIREKADYGRNRIR